MVKYITKFIPQETRLSLEEYREKGGFEGLKRSLEMRPFEVTEQIESAGLSGRGGAYFPTGAKWKMVAEQENPVKYVICNADEGEPGTFKDRKLIRRTPFQIWEGMIIAAYAVSAQEGYLYLRGEYEDLLPQLEETLADLRGANLLGTDILGTSFCCDIKICVGAGAYICGEETALIESIEGKRGTPRLKPPFPGENGLWECPTLVNNVETLCNVPLIFSLGNTAYHEHGTGATKGTKLISLSGAVCSPGVYEVPFGTPLEQLIAEAGGGLREGTDIQFVQIGGLTGSCIPASQVKDIALYPAAMKAHGLTLGSGAVYVAGTDVDVRDYLCAAMEFFAHESCGRCAPCREGTRHLAGILERMAKDGTSENDLLHLREIATAMTESSACGLGQTAPTVLTGLLNLFPDAFAEV